MNPLFSLFSDFILLFLLKLCDDYLMSTVEDSRSISLLFISRWTRSSFMNMWLWSFWLFSVSSEKLHSLNSRSLCAMPMTNWRFSRETICPRSSFVRKQHGLLNSMPAGATIGKRVPMYDIHQICLFNSYFFLYWAYREITIETWGKHEPIERFWFIANFRLLSLEISRLSSRVQLLSRRKPSHLPWASCSRLSNFARKYDITAWILFTYYAYRTIVSSRSDFWWCVETGHSSFGTNRDCATRIDQRIRAITWT